MKRKLVATCAMILGAGTIGVDLTIGRPELFRLAYGLGLIFTGIGNNQFLYYAGLSASFIAPLLLVFGPLYASLSKFSKRRYGASLLWSGAVLVIGAGLVHQDTRTYDEIGNHPSVGPGFLLPTKESIPADFNREQTYFTPMLYTARWSGPIRDGNGVSESIDFTEDLRTDYKLGEFSIGQKTFNGLRPSMQEFSFRTSPGKLARSEISSGLMYYELVWNDRGHPVNITLVNVPTTDFPPERVIALLGTMAVSAGGETLNF